LKYSDPQYIEALRILEEDDRVSTLGLCNFDAAHMKVVLENGIKVATNQVQVRKSSEVICSGYRRH